MSDAIPWRFAVELEDAVLEADGDHPQTTLRAQVGEDAGLEVEGR